MKKTHKTFGVIAVIAIVVIVIASYSGVISIPGILTSIGNGNQNPEPMPEPIDSDPLPEFDDFEIWSILCQLTDKDLDRTTTYEYIERLNMEVFGSDTSYVDIYGEYSLYYENKGWDITIREFPTFPNGDGAIIGYTNDIYGAMVMTASTNYIQTVYGYNTMTLTSHGTAADYVSFYNFIDMS